MSTPMINRRGFLTLPLVALFSLISRANAEFAVRRGQYAADSGVLDDMLTFQLQGTIEESIDRAAGEYRVVIAGQGTSIASRIDSSGILQNGRWAPRRSSSWFNV